MLVGVFHMFMGLVSAYWLLVITATVAGVAISSGILRLLRPFRRGSPEEEALQSLWHGMGGSIGEALGPLLVGSLLSVMLWRTVLQGGVVPAVIHRGSGLAGFCGAFKEAIGLRYRSRLICNHCWGCCAREHCSPYWWLPLDSAPPRE